MGKYIINFEDNSGIAPNREKYYKCCEIPWWVAAKSTLNKLTPYTEPDLEAVRKEAYDKGYDDATAEISSDEQAIAEKAYQKGLSDAWEAARKIARCFLWGSYQRETGRSSACAQDVLEHYSASEAIEKIRQYEQEKDRRARIEYNFDEIKDVIETTAKEYNMSLDEIAEVLKKMGEH